MREKKKKKKKKEVCSVGFYIPRSGPENKKKQDSQKCQKRISSAAR
jgi:hypothetical protein